MSEDEVRINLDRCFRRDLLWRLKWNLLAPVDDIEIATGPPDQITNLPLRDHTLSRESLADPPLSCIDEISIGDFSAKLDREMAIPKEWQFQPPASLKINNQDGAPITLGQFVAEVHEYVGRNVDGIKNVKAEMYGEPCTDADGNHGRMHTFGRPTTLPDCIGMYFKRVWAYDVDGRVSVSVMLWAEGEFGMTLEQFWAMRALQLRNYERS
ncbi:hypothetical protein FB567DRAFT_452497 [Paraphoma chrysanthemicola]|uniref:Uncharacterized protein n=1 Tax=Paraphoma chrysanthemicola TaxID=798071 RepID=A0A8K0VU14_9PLEO|nr:hypothetical protein FB567DRAFT_452497 [Paraphoma chrysanthemicola]